MNVSASGNRESRGIAGGLAARLTPKRLTVWGTGLLILSWGLYIYVMAVPGYIDRAGRFKGTDYIYFYVMGSLLGDGRTAALYDSAAHLAEGKRRITPELTLYAEHSNYGPQIALVFTPLARLPFAWSLTLFLLLTAAGYAFSVWLVWRECPALQGYGRVVAVLAAASPPFLALVRYAQLSVVSLLIWSVALVALKRGREFLAGLTIGCLIFKPQLGVVVGVALLAAGHWRLVTGAAVSAIGQLALGWLVGGSDAMRAYLGVLWRLIRNPSLVQLYPSEIHSIRGFFQLMMPGNPIVTVCSLAGLIVALVVAIRVWSRQAPVNVRWGVLLLLTILTSPHLVTYDLVLLTIPLLLFADWAVANPDDPKQPAVALLLVLAYLAPFSSNFARLTHVQSSVVVMALLAVGICRSRVFHPARQTV